MLFVQVRAFVVFSMCPEFHSVMVSALKFKLWYMYTHLNIHRFVFNLPSEQTFFLVIYSALVAQVFTDQKNYLESFSFHQQIMFKWGFLVVVRFLVNVWFHLFVCFPSSLLAFWFTVKLHINLPKYYHFSFLCTVFSPLICLVVCIHYICQHFLLIMPS